ncbi:MULTISPECIES: serine/threonine-protein kinase [unclassified Thermosynechococcus]|uniref:serine/threonine-protein kinase n=1 Tax=unclassified Thermosynechococcus TaxID=2622553 RepID=UPI0019EBC756|nr:MULTISPECIES: serine/threonine-protein kinase [unclassified Thermosynechococcus]HIK36325.1 serine/threonine protein kinase [Thermosynechococcus sp. M98_K2018_005]HIK48275.1 serine/threonine protein kinase [Thermosynechococcus sp. M55_K2018_012]
MLVYCTRPYCRCPQNDVPDLDNPNKRYSRVAERFCTACGMPLILRGRYVAERVLGQGGFGAAYLARDLDTPGRRECVIKQFRPNVSDPQSRQKALELFEREGQVLDQLGQHAQIPDLLAFFAEEVPSVDGQEVEQYFYLVQEYIDGETLEDELQEKGPFSEEDVRQVLRELLPVLQYVHDHGSIHRDIKLSNIMRQHPSKTKLPGQGRLYLLDFGAVKQISQAGGQQGHFTGIYTQYYGPPEQARGERVYPSSDLYALAVTCIVLLTGKDPSELFDAYNNRWHWHSYAQVSPKLQAILDRMLQPAPSDRYQSAAEVLADLNASPTPVPAPQPVTPAPSPPPVVSQPAPPPSPAPVTPPTSTPRPKAKPPRQPAPPLPALKILIGAGFTGFEMTALGLMIFSLMTAWQLPVGVSAGLIGALFAFLVFLQYKRWIEHWEQLIIAVISGAVLFSVPLLQAGLGGVTALLICGLVGLGCVVMGNIFLLIYNTLARFL